VVRPLEKSAEIQRGEPLFRQIVRALAHRIFTGEYPPGSQLPPERELALRLGVSRATLREALKQLISYGLLSAHQGSGTVVLNWKEEGGLELVPLFLDAGAPGLTLDRLLPTALRLRRVLIEEIVRWLADRPDGGWVKKAQEHLEKAWSFRMDPMTFIALDFSFVRFLAGESGFFPALWILNELHEIYLHFVQALPSPPPIPRGYRESWRKVLELCQEKRGREAVERIGAYFSALDANLLHEWGLG
jgi:DNA-binding FadR family transcriptional regulator